MAELDNGGPDKDQDQNDQLPGAAAGTSRTTTVTTTTATQSGIKLLVDTQANTVSIGD